MPEFTTVSVQEAQLRTIPGRQGKFINEYADYIQQVPKGQAGRLRTKRRYTRRRREEAELPPPDQPIDELGMTEQGTPVEASPELGQTDQVVEDAMRRVDPE